MKNYKKMSYPKIWVSNSCGKLFFFELVPKDEDGGIEEWWDNNDIDHVVGNNHNSCEWGEYESTKNIKTPEGGWVTEETDDEEDNEPSEICIICSAGQQKNPPWTFWPNDYDDYREKNCI